MAPSNKLQLIENYLTPIIIKKVLTEDLKNPSLDFTDVSIELEPCREVSEWSVVTTLKIKYGTVDAHDQIRNYFVKYTDFANGDTRRIRQQCCKELMIYEDVLPYMEEKFLEMKLPSLKTPILLHGKVETEFCVLIMNDLCSDNFKMVEKNRHYDLDHIKLVMEELGRFHAGYVLWERDEGCGESIGESKEDLFEEPWVQPNGDGYEAMFKFLSAGFKIIVSLLDKVDSFPLSKNWLKQHDSECVKILDEANKPTDEFRVLSHGGTWGNNFLYQYDQGGIPVDLRILNFKYCGVSTPALDIIFTIYSKMCPKVRKAHHKEIISAYYDSFLTVLLTDVEEFIPFTLTELEDVLQKRFISVLMIAMAQLQVSFQSREETPAEWLGQESIEDYNQKRVRINNKLFDEVPEFRERFLGIFEDMEELIQNGDLI